MKTVVATGVFDILHPGHVLFLEEARKLGDRLVVIVARDGTAQKRKYAPRIPEKQRLAIVCALRAVDEALLGDHSDMYRPIEAIDPDIIALGCNQHFDEKEMRDELKRRGLKASVVRIGRHLEDELASSRKIAEKIRNS